MIRMKHPSHGFTHANSVQEIEEMKRNGWEPDEPETDAREPESEPVQVMRGRGRPPKERE